jgi:hypothetical protein
MTDLLDSGWYSLTMQQKQKCATLWTSNDYFLGARAQKNLEKLNFNYAVSNN